MSERIYVIVARNLDLADGSKMCMTSGRIAAHVAHAVLKMEESYLGDTSLWDCEIIILCVPNSSDFAELLALCTRQQIPTAVYLDTDKLWQGEQLTAICTHPLGLEQRKIFAQLKPWKCACNDKSKNDLRPSSSTVEHSVLTEGITAGRSSGAPVS